MKKPFVQFCTVLLAVMFSAAQGQDTIYVNDEDGAPGYVEVGDFSQSATGGYIGTYRFTDADREPSHAIWTPTVLVAGNYDVSVGFLASTNRTINAPHTITHAGGTSVVSVNQYSSSIKIQEVPLGRFTFDAGTDGHVRIDNNGGSGIYITDTVIFRPAVDTPPTITSVGKTPSFPQATEPVYVHATIQDDDAVTSVVVHFTAAPSGGNGMLTAANSSGDLYEATIPGMPDGEEVNFWFRAVDLTNNETVGDPQVYLVGEQPPKEWRSIWADTWNASILNQSQVDDLINTARNNNINTVMIEIRKIGDAYYNSSLEPRATNISGGASFDPLQATIDAAHGDPKKVHVHAWFVMQRITKGETLDPQHILSQRPDLMMSNHLGETSASGNRYLDPGHPDAVEHNVAVILDCLANYDIDGINLDYIRYSEYSGSWGYNPVSVARFNAYYGKSGQPATSDPDWANWRRECNTLQVKKIYVKAKMVKPHVLLTTCTVNWGSGYTDATWPGSSAYNGVYQDWKGWLQEGIIDYNALMNYVPTSTPARYNGWTNFSLANDDIRGSIIGIGAYMQTSVQASMDQLLYARNQGAAGLNIYDWGSETNNTAETTEQFYAELKSQVFTEWVDPPDPEWIVAPTKGIFEGNLTSENEPIDHGMVTIDELPGKQTVTDGYGWFGFLEVPPGVYTLRFSKPDYGEIVRVAEIVEGGDIITVNADFASGVDTWMIL